jgi:hypothetical protein
MKRTLWILAGLALVALIWFKSRKTAAETLGAAAQASDLTGRIGENVGLANRPRLASDEQLYALSGILTQASPQRQTEGTPTTLPRDPFLFGF